MARAAFTAGYRGPRASACPTNQLPGHSMQPDRFDVIAKQVICHYPLLLGEGQSCWPEVRYSIRQIVDDSLISPTGERVEKSFGFACE